MIYALAHKLESPLAYGTPRAGFKKQFPASDDTVAVKFAQYDTDMHFFRLGVRSLFQSTHWSMQSWKL